MNKASLLIAKNLANATKIPLGKIIAFIRREELKNEIELMVDESRVEFDVEKILIQVRRRELNLGGDGDSIAAIDVPENIKGAYKDYQSCKEW